MNFYITLLKGLICATVFCFATLAYADEPTANNAVDHRVEQEKAILDNPFSIGFYKPNYILPYYYTGSPDESVYENNTPDEQSINHQEFKYQLSFKVPIWQFNSISTLYGAYTQLSYWQVYNESPFFRETDYEPELFLANHIDKHLSDQWNLSFLNVGAVHQSNGYGGTMERSWNRLYAEGIFAKENWIISLKPWYILPDNAIKDHNPNIVNYMGHGRVLVGYKFDSNQMLNVEARNLVESGFSKGAVQADWSFPITKHLNGYVQIFSGYGQSLIEYNHFTNSAGIGIALSNWI